MNKEKYNILYVDDKKSDLIAFKSLYGSKFNIVTAGFGREGISIVESQPIHLIIVAQEMSDMTGIEFIKKLKFKWAGIKCILLAEVDDYKVIKEALNEVGVYSYMNKPFDTNQMENLIVKAIEACNAEKEKITADSKLQMFMESAMDAIITIDKNQVITMANLSAYTMFGYNRGELIGESVTMLIPKDKVANHSHLVNNFGASSQTKRYMKSGSIVCGKTKSGKLIAIETSLSKIELNGELFYNAFIRDVTQKIEAERLIKESEEKFRGVFNSITDVFFRSDKEGKCILVSPSVHDVTGYTVDEVIGSKIADFYVNPKERNSLLLELLEKGSVKNFETEVIKKDGTIFIGSADAKLLKKKSGQFLGVESILRDVSSLKKTEDQLRLSQKQYQDLYEHAPIAYFSVGTDGRIKRCNQGAVELLGFPKEILVGKPVIDLYADTLNGKAKARQVFQHFISRKTVLNEELQMQTENGNIIWIKLTVNVVLNEKGKNIESRSMIVDITELKKADEAKEKLLHDTGERLKELNCLVAISNSIKTRQSSHEIFQDTVRAIPFGWHYPEITRCKLRYMDKVYVSKPFKETQWKQSSNITALGKICGSIEVYYMEECRTIDEGPFMKEERDLIDNIAWTLGEAIDLRQAEKDLWESEKSHRTLIEQAKDGIALLQDGNVKYVNSAMSNLTGFSEAELLNKPINTFVTREEAVRISRLFNDGMDSETNSSIYESVFKNKDGETVEVEYNIGLTTYKEELAILGIFRDITERKKTERALQLSETNLVKAQEVGHIGSWYLDLLENNLIWSDENYRIFGIAKGTTMNYEKFIEAIHPQDRDFVNTSWTAGVEGKPYDIEHRLLINNEIKWVREKAEVFFDSNGKPINAVGVTQDITERILAEQALRDSELRFRTILQTAGIIIVTFTKDYKIAEFNNAAESLFNATREEVLGKDFLELFVPKQHRKELKNHIKNNLKGVGIGNFEIEVLSFSGSRFLLQWNIRRFQIPSSRKYGIIACGTDITVRRKTEDALLESEEKFRTLVTKTEEIFYMIDKDGTFLLSEGKGLSKLGLKPGEVVGKSVFDLYKDFPAMLDKMRETFNGKIIISEEEVGGQYFRSWYVPHINRKKKIIGLLGLSVNISEQKEAEVIISDYQNRLKALGLELTITEERLRKQIATDLHDDVGQLLSSIRMQLSTINIDSEKLEILKKIKFISQGLLKAIQATRSAIFNLSPPQLNEIGLNAAIHDWMKEEIEMKSAIKTKLTSEKKKYALEENTRVLLFRSIREIMMNVVKHAQAKHMNIDISEMNGMMEICIEDDGVGFDYNGDLIRLKSKSFGLFSIQERMLDLGGAMEIESTLGKGTRIRLLIPMNE
jgi:PAS domain S-box-containing protein